MTSFTPKRHSSKYNGKKVRPYLEYRYINIKGSQTPELLDKVNKIWLKHSQAIIKALEEREQILRILIAAESTPPIEP